MSTKHVGTPRSYRWSLAISPRRASLLSPEGHEGLSCAQTLAQAAEERSLAALRGEEIPPRYTVAQLAREEYVSPSAIYRAIKQARVELFGRDLSDRALRYRVRRDRKAGEPGTRPCAEPDCTRKLPLYATARRRYCVFHGDSHARVARLRASRRASPSPTTGASLAAPVEFGSRDRASPESRVG